MCEAAKVQGSLVELHDRCFIEVQALEQAPGAVPGEAANTAGAPPLLFLHGAGHTSWAFAEHWMPWFHSRGHDCYAVSMRGHVRLRHQCTCCSQPTFP